MRVWVAPDTLAKLQLTVTDIVNAISAQNVVNPAGTLGGEPAPPGQQLTYTVRAQGRLMNAEEFGDIILRANPDGSLVRLKDVARIELGAENYTQQAYINGAPATLAAALPEPRLQRARGRQPRQGEDGRAGQALSRATWQSTLTLDTTVPVTEGAKEIVKTLLEAIGLVILVVFIFLQNWRATLIPILTIPVSLVGAFMFFPAVGFSINTLSLLGLVLAVGLVVDDAIVVVEAIEAKIEQGLSPRDAALEAMDEVGGALVGIALVLSAVFIPAGIHGRHHRLALPPVRAHHRILGPDLGLQRAHAESRLWRAPAAAAKQHGAPRPARALLRRVQRGFARVQTTATSRGSELLIRKVVVALAILVGFVVLAGGLGKTLPRRFCPTRTRATSS